MNIVQEIRSTDYLRRIIAPVGGQGGVVPVPELQQFPSGRLRLVGLWERTTKWWCAICGEKYDWRQPNRLLVVQKGESFEQAKVFKAHAVPQGLCANLINALKLLANQEEDGDGLLQNIVTNLGKGNRKGLTDGLRDFMKVDNHRALDLGELHRGTGTFQVWNPKAPEGGSDVTIRESPDEKGGRSEHLEGVERCQPH